MERYRIIKSSDPESYY